VGVEKNVSILEEMMVTAEAGEKTTPSVCSGDPNNLQLVLFRVSLLLLGCRCVKGVKWRQWASDIFLI
jgi:hypothetical protein